MKVLVCGVTGCVGSAVARALRSRGHEVIAGGRSAVDGPRAMHIDFAVPVAPAIWAVRLRERGVQVVVNAVGILIPQAGQSFERVHARGPIELFEGASSAGVECIVQVSALGVADDAVSRAVPYLETKRVADAALAALPVGWAVLRPSLVYGPGSQSARLFATLASLPVIGLPGLGGQQVAPVHVFELAEAIVRLIERAEPANAVLEVGGPEAMGYREMLASYRATSPRNEAIWLPLPPPLMRLGARLAEALPQRVFSRDTLRLLDRGSVPRRNALPTLLGRAPTALVQGLSVSPPEPLFDLGVILSAPMAKGLRASLATMWLYTALISALLPERSGVLNLLAHCGFEGRAGVAALVASCVLNTTLGALTLWRPQPLLYAVQAGAIVGYTAAAALAMPELTIDHCGPLVKNLPVLMVVLVLWMASPQPSAEPGGRATSKRGRANQPMMTLR